MKFLNAIDRYIAKLVFVPLISTLVIAAMLLLLDKMLRLFDFVAAEGGPVSIVWRMLANMMPEYLSLGIPIGVTLGILLGFRRMAMSSELDALNASVLESLLKEANVPYIARPMMGAGISAALGVTLEKFVFFVAYRDYARAQEQLEALLAPDDHAADADFADEDEESEDEDE